MRSTLTRVLSVVLGNLAGLGISAVISAIISMQNAYLTYLDIFFGVPVVMMVWVTTISVKRNTISPALFGVSVLVGSLLYLSLLKGVQMW